MAKKTRETNETKETRDDLVSVLREYTGKENIGIKENPEDTKDSPVVAQRKQEILEAALNVFSKKGFDGSRTKEIAIEGGGFRGNRVQVLPDQAKHSCQRDSARDRVHSETYFFGAGNKNNR